MKTLFGSTLFFLVMTLPLHAQTLRLSVDQTYHNSSLSTAAHFFTRVEDKRSYCCQIWSSSFASPFFDQFQPTAPLLDLADRTSNAPRISSSLSTFSNFGSARNCFSVSEPNDTQTTPISIGIDSSDDPIIDANLLCTETTLFGGFNTVVTDFNFIEITNTLMPAHLGNIGGHDITVHIYARGTINDSELINTTFVVPANKRRDFDIHSIVPNDFGPVIITHNGPQGSLRAINSQYRIVAQDPLDFEPVLTVPFREGLSK